VAILSRKTDKALAGEHQPTSEERPRATGSCSDATRSRNSLDGLFLFLHIQRIPRGCSVGVHLNSLRRAPVGGQLFAPLARWATPEPKFPPPQLSVAPKPQNQATLVISRLEESRTPRRSHRRPRSRPKPSGSRSLQLQSRWRSPTASAVQLMRRAEARLLYSVEKILEGSLRIE
jgi:hypothetical protein